MPTDKLSTISTCRRASYSLRNAEVRDAKEISRLVRDSGVLNENSCYAYLLLCDHFRDTCYVAESSDEVVGFVAAYCPPSRPDSVFVWQIGVAPGSRRHGLGKQLLHRLVASPACGDVRYLEATITPSNVSSQRLFTSFADELNASVEVETCYLSEHFDTPFPEPEVLYRIGPLPTNRPFLTED